MEGIEDQNWRKASYSGNGGGNCVEVGNLSGDVAVRDTKDRAGAVLAFSPATWRAALAKIKAEN